MWCLWDFLLFVYMFLSWNWIQQGPVLKGVRQDLFTCSLQHPPLSWPPGKLFCFSVKEYPCFSISQNQSGRWCLGSSPHEHFEGSIWAGRHLCLHCNTFTLQDWKGQENAPQPHPLGMFSLFLRAVASWALGFWQSQALQWAWIVGVFKVDAAYLQACPLRQTNEGYILKS